jgi:lipopolysaccharide export system ATP-binding protein
MTLWSGGKGMRAQPGTQTQPAPEKEPAAPEPQKSSRNMQTNGWTSQPRDARVLRARQDGGRQEGQPTAVGAPGPATVRPARDASQGLSIHSIMKSFGKRLVVKGVSIGVGRGEAVGLLGPNGAGKTTVFYMITGLIKPDKGRVLIDGFDATKLPMYRRARLGIGYLPQEASIFRGLTVEQNIRAVLEVAEPDRRERNRRLEELLEEFHIARLRKSPSIALSGGERRRVEIARALASNPSYMLLDEPFAGIDPIAIGDIRTLVRHLTRRGIGVLITDHNVRETLELIDRAYIIYDGKVLTEGSPAEIVANEDVRRVYLGNMFSD